MFSMPVMRTAWRLTCLILTVCETLAKISLALAFSPTDGDIDSPIFLVTFALRKAYPSFRLYKYIPIA